MTFPVLFDNRGKRDGQLQGKSPWLQSVNVIAPERLLGQIVDVKITEATQNSLTGEVVTVAPQISSAAHAA
jgi:tRNA-2-methylthio-N6-dimethylallyladenosine synthase